VVDKLNMNTEQGVE